jgi:hypothetical protein
LTQVEAARLAQVDCVDLWLYEKKLRPADMQYQKLWKQLLTVAKKVKVWRLASREFQFS